MPSGQNPPWVLHEKNLSTGTRNEFFFFFGFESTQLAQRANYIRNAQGWRCSNKVARRRLARRHYCNSCHMFVCTMVCSCSQHALDVKMLFFRFFVRRKGYCVTILRRSESKLLRESVEFTEEQQRTTNASVLFERQI